KQVRQREERVRADVVVPLNVPSQPDQREHRAEQCDVRRQRAGARRRRGNPHPGCGEIHPPTSSYLTSNGKTVRNGPPGPFKVTASSHCPDIGSSMPSARKWPAPSGPAGTGASACPICAMTGSTLTPVGAGVTANVKLFARSEER